MDNIQSYIESGILELYVLGNVTPEEKLQVEEMMALHQTVRAEVDEIERALEVYAGKNAVEPAADNCTHILNSLVSNLADDNISPLERKDDNVIALPRANNFYKYAFAASLLLLLGVSITLYNVYNKLEQSNDQLLALSQENQQFAKTVNLKEQQISVFRDPAFKLFRLQGTEKTPDAGLTIAWNPKSKKVMIDMVDMKLPATDHDHQYQLWAMVNGKPVDLGVFDKPTVDTTDMVEMKSIALAQAFAVTIERRGGSRNPTLDEMVVIKSL
ncbi:MAG: anti-sigma factor [Sphingobacteriaceae bacterium]|nr:MAG: anti-sigma factor [Sphingobacteriaceae bacterium]